MNNIETATFGGGCFWCIEAIMQRLEGMEKVVSGYAGGSMPNPDYRSVCYGNTGHAEVVQVTFNKDVISYEDLLLVFMGSHEPTSLNKQGADIGTQYRSVIYYHNDEQKETAKVIINEFQNQLKKKVVTELSPLDVFYPAESYHQDYYNRNPYAGYCYAVINPKIAKLKKMFSDKLKEHAH